MEEEKFKVPIWEKLTLSIKEAAEYSGIGETRIRLLCETTNIGISVGNHQRVKRKELEKLIQNISDL